MPPTSKVAGYKKAIRELVLKKLDGLEACIQLLVACVCDIDEPSWEF